MLSLLASLAAVAVPLPPQEGSALDGAIIVRNEGASARRETVRVSLPCARGQLRGGADVEIGGRAVPAVPLVRWPDGSVAVLQAHLPCVLGPDEVRRLPVRLRPAAPQARPWPGRWLVAAELPLHTEIEDPWGQVYTARLVADAGLHPTSSPLVRVRRYEGVHRRGRAELLGVVAWLTTFRGERRAELTLVLDNGANLEPAEPPGPVRLRTFALVTQDERLRFRPRFARENVLEPPVRAATGGYRQPLLGPSDQIYLGDRTAKAFRFDLFFDGEDATDEERASAAAAPLHAWPDLDWVRRTGAFGAHGGPAPAGRDSARSSYADWRAQARFGPFGGHGDAEDAAAQGSPRNGPSALHNVLRWRSGALLRASETAVLQQCLRPTPGHEPRLPGALEPFRAGLSPRCIARPHGFTPLTYEHFSVDLLYDYYWLTGDPLARAELHRAGGGLMRLLDGVPFLTCRGEGWCAQAAVLIARATGDRGLVHAVAQRMRGRVLPEIGAGQSTAVLAQPPHDDAFGPGEPFDAPWQMAALVHGLHALWCETGEAALAEAAVRTAGVMAGAGWLEGRGPKYLVSARDPSRYTMPVGFAPMEGTAWFEIGAFVLAAEMSGQQELRALFRSRADAIARAGDRPELHDADRWMQLYLDRLQESR